MPIPKPRDNESEDDFVGRCMGDDVMVEEYPENDQRFAICNTAWRNRNKESEMDIERKSIQIELKDDKPGAFTARIAQFDVMDSDSDVTLPGSFPKGKAVLISAYQHGSWMGELPVGKAIIKEDGEFAIAEGQFNLSTDTGREHYEAVKFTGELQEWSYGFKVLEQGSEKELEDWAEQHDGSKPSRIIKKVDPFEISPVMKGAGIGTATLAIKNSVGGFTYSYQADIVLAAVEALVERTKSLAELRRKEGRVLSQSNRDKMKKLLSSLSDVAKDLKELLDSTEPVDKAAVERMQAEFMKINFELAEVK